jgi:adenine-specific DNA-methyltransferase
LGGFKFRRQHQIGSFIVDFICIEKKLIIELDGGQHAESISKDAERSLYLNKKGFRVRRYWNHEMLCQTESVLESILADLNAPSPQSSPPAGARQGGNPMHLLPARGEGRDEGR